MSWVGLEPIGKDVPSGLQVAALELESAVREDGLWPWRDGDLGYEIGDREAWSRFVQLNVGSVEVDPRKGAGYRGAVVELFPELDPEALRKAMRTSSSEYQVTVGSDLLYMRHEREALRQFGDDSVDDRLDLLD